MPVKKQRKQNNKKRENKSKEGTTQVRKSTAREKVFKLSQFIKPLVNYQGAKDVGRGGRREGEGEGIGLNPLLRPLWKDSGPSLS